MLALSSTSLTTYPNPINTNPATSYSAFLNPLTMASFYYPENPVLTVANRIEDGSWEKFWEDDKKKPCPWPMSFVDRLVNKLFGCNWGICPRQTTEETSSLQKRQAYQITNFTYEMTNGTRCDILNKLSLDSNGRYAIEIAAVKAYKNFGYLTDLSENCSFYTNSLSFLYDSEKTSSPYIFDIFKSDRCSTLSTCIQSYLDEESKHTSFIKCENLSNPKQGKINQSYAEYKIKSYAYTHLTYLLSINSKQISDGKPTNINIDRTNRIAKWLTPRIRNCEDKEAKLYAELRAKYLEEKKNSDDIGISKRIIVGGLLALTLAGTGFYIICKAHCNRLANHEAAGILPSDESTEEENTESHESGEVLAEIELSEEETETLLEPTEETIVALNEVKSE